MVKESSGEIVTYKKFVYSEKKIKELVDFIRYTRNRKSVSIVFE